MSPEKWVKEWGPRDWEFVSTPREGDTPKSAANRLLDPAREGIAVSVMSEAMSSSFFIGMQVGILLCVPFLAFIVWTLR